MLYKEILHDKITEKYKSDQDNVIDQNNKDGCNFTNKLNIKNELGKLNRKDANINFKDHKQNSENNKQARLINPIKTELGLISKNIIQRFSVEEFIRYYWMVQEYPA